MGFLMHFRPFLVKKKIRFGIFYFNLYFYFLTKNSPFSLVYLFLKLSSTFYDSITKFSHHYTIFWYMFIHIYDTFFLSIEIQWDNIIQHCTILRYFNIMWAWMKSNLFFSYSLRISYWKYFYKIVFIDNYFNCKWCDWHLFRHQITHQMNSHSSSVFIVLYWNTVIK